MIVHVDNGPAAIEINPADLKSPIPDGTYELIPIVSQLHVVDLKRHHDGEDGIVGPFSCYTAAEQYIEAMTDQWLKRWATIRPINAI